ncbi:MULTISPECIES: ABC transporter ATP-binding protein [unclassified Nitratiruptor]|uniref:ABC transporter ATP-binding protein n=1 Tax=unclassified Nitratiruptor TaxID=2624044 RepID=UPI001915784B|nr:MULTISPECIES: ABC transporter ATP-binding protein [unclassified Nitratiruptor]BCD61060.1 ABC-2 type transport system ATP-binding protein [Nitratiruptor sp. YY08-10]BCD64993.1 ABC-2 type transport system ATP-binding protein [Nitratiruptor sp. YY08-14]
MIEVRGATKRFLDVNVLDGIDLTIEDGDKIALMGPNGAGKTTLVRSILGFYHLDSGSIRVNGSDPIKERQNVLHHISFIPQTPPPIKLSLTELMEYVSKSSGVKRESIEQEAKKMDLALEKNLSKPFFKLSGGMKQKMLIAIALAKQSDILIFDEPTANLDPKARERFYSLLQELDQKVTTIYITHRLEEVESLINRKIYMDLGKVVEDERV